jgi:hypothetical protein
MLNGRVLQRRCSRNLPARVNAPATAAGLDGIAGLIWITAAAFSSQTESPALFDEWIRAWSDVARDSKSFQRASRPPRSGWPGRC